MLRIADASSQFLTGANRERVYIQADNLLSSQTKSPQREKPASTADIQKASSPQIRKLQKFGQRVDRDSLALRVQGPLNEPLPVLSKGKSDFFPRPLSCFRSIECSLCHDKN